MNQKKKKRALKIFFPFSLKNTLVAMVCITPTPTHTSTPPTHTHHQHTPTPHTPPTHTDTLHRLTFLYIFQSFLQFASQFLGFGLGGQRTFQQQYRCFSAVYAHQNVEEVEKGGKGTSLCCHQRIYNPPPPFSLLLPKSLSRKASCHV